jgi:hypothetical protein
MITCFVKLKSNKKKEENESNGEQDTHLHSIHMYLLNLIMEESRK